MRMNGETRKEREGGTESRREGAREGGREENNSHSFCERNKAKRTLTGFREHVGSLQTPNMGQCTGCDHKPHHPLCTAAFSIHKKPLQGSQSSKPYNRGGSSFLEG